MINILVTGFSGFIGSQLDNLKYPNWTIKSFSFTEFSITNETFTGIDKVVHLAGIAHRMEKTDSSLYYDVNHKKTIEFARQAKVAGVNQFVFMSTAKVYGLDSSDDVLDVTSECKPNDPYGHSKLLAENSLMELEDDSFKISIVRTPLVYGPGVKGNMLRIMSLIDRYKYLPFGEIKNKRSMVYVGNLLYLVQKIIEKDVGGIFIAGDEKSMSTSDLCLLISDKMGKKSKWISIPYYLRLVISKAFPSQYVRLFESLELSPKSTFDRLDLSPKYSTEQGIDEMVRWYVNSIKK